MGTQKGKGHTYLRESTGVYTTEFSLPTNRPLQEHSGCEHGGEEHAS